MRNVNVFIQFKLRNSNIEFKFEKSLNIHQIGGEMIFKYLKFHQIWIQIIKNPNKSIKF